jgi:ribonuclease P protein component
MSVRFGPAVRLRSRREFTAVQQQGRRVSATCLTLLARPNAFNVDRLGIIASRRVGDAVTRNRVKRRFRETFRLCEPDRRPKRRGGFGVDFVVIARPEASTVSMDTLRADFLSAMDRLEARVRP